MIDTMKETSDMFQLFDRDKLHHDVCLEFSPLNEGHGCFRQSRVNILEDKVNRLQFDQREGFHQNEFEYQFHRQKEVNSHKTMVLWGRIGILVFIRQNIDDILTDEVTYEDFIRWIDDCISFVWQNGACLTKQWNPHCPITRWKNDYVMTKEEAE